MSFLLFYFNQLEAVFSLRKWNPRFTKKASQGEWLMHFFEGCPVRPHFLIFSGILPESSETAADALPRRPGVEWPGPALRNRCLR